MIDDLFFDKGLLWAVNKYILHPQGFALALDVTDRGISDYKLLGDGTEPWAFADDDHEEFRRFEAWLNDARRA